MNSAPIEPLISTSDLDKIDVRIGTKWVAGSSCRWGPLTPPSTLRSSKNSPLARRQRAPSPSCGLCPLRVHKIKKSVTVQFLRSRTWGFA
jgi:hypothetical protein